MEINGEFLVDITNGAPFDIHGKNVVFIERNAPLRTYIAQEDIPSAAHQVAKKLYGKGWEDAHPEDKAYMLEIAVTCWQEFTNLGYL